jgi:hypothetical protein
MNEQDLEKRLRSVTSGQQPAAPQSLRTFLRGLPETEARRRRGPLGALRSVLSAVSSLAPGLPAARRLQVAAAVSFAIVLSLIGAGLLVSLRQAQNQPLASLPSQTTRPTQVVTPRRTTPQVNVLPLVVDDSLYWYGVVQIDNDNAALPIETVARPGSAYLGISAPPYGMNGIVRSELGLLWEWSPISEVDASLAGLTSISADTTGRTVVVGWATTADGIRDGRAYYSDNGYTWSPAADQSIFAGTVVRKVVYGPSGWVALGWSDGSQADAVRPVVEWVSGDGTNWTRVSGVPIRGTSAMLIATAGGYVMSGSAIKTGDVDQPPIWYSTDGLAWNRATTTDNTAQKLGALSSLTLVGSGTLVGLSGLGDGTSTQLVESLDAGRTWHEIAASGFTAPALVTHVASLSTGMGSQWLLATCSAEKAQVYVSKDGGWTWKAVAGETFSPLGTMLVEVGPGYGVDYKRVLVFGLPSERLGLWIASTEQIAWP